MKSLWCLVTTLLMVWPGVSPAVAQCPWGRDPQLIHLQGCKFMSCSHFSRLVSTSKPWLLIGCTRVNNQSEASSTICRAVDTNMTDYTNMTDIRHICVFSDFNSTLLNLRVLKYKFWIVTIVPVGNILNL